MCVYPRTADEKPALHYRVQRLQSEPSDRGRCSRLWWKQTACKSTPALLTSRVSHPPDGLVAGVSQTTQATTVSLVVVVNS